MAGMDPHHQHCSDAEHRKETDLVDYSVLYSARLLHYGDPGVDGDRGGSEQAELVGHFDDRADRESDRPGLPGVGGLIRRDSKARVTRTTRRSVRCGT